MSPYIAELINYLPALVTFVTNSEITKNVITAVAVDRGIKLLDKSTNFIKSLISHNPENLVLLEEVKNGNLSKKEELVKIIEVELITDKQKNELKEIVKEIKNLNIQGDLVMGNKTEFRDNSKQFNIHGNYVENQNLSNTEI